MKTIASVLGVEEDPGMEKATDEFLKQVGRTEELDAQDTLTPFEQLQSDWDATRAIVDAYEQGKVVDEKAVLRNLRTTSNSVTESS